MSYCYKNNGMYMYHLQKVLEVFCYRCVTFMYAYSTTQNLGQNLKEVLVTMEKQLIKKPFLGGYRNQQTGIEYHHASAQTLPKRILENEVMVTSQ